MASNGSFTEVSLDDFYQIISCYESNAWKPMILNIQDYDDGGI